MATINLYIENELNSLQEISTINNDIDKLEKILSNVKPGPHARRLKSEIYLKMSDYYINMAIFIYLKGDNDKAYHLVRIGDAYLNKCMDINIKSEKYIELQRARMRYYFLFAILKEPRTYFVIYDVFDIGEAVSFSLATRRNITNFFIFLDQLHREGLMDSTMCAYQALIALAGFVRSDEKLTKDNRLVLMTDSLKRLNPTHPCYQELQTKYNEYLENLPRIPLAISNKNIFSLSKWYRFSLMDLCDNWFILKTKNKFLYQPSRLLKSVSGIDFNKEYNFSESYPASALKDSKEIAFNISVTELELVKFISHLHPLSFSLGSSPFSPTFIIDLALKKHGYLDKYFRYAGDDKLKELKDPKEAFLLFQTIKDFSAKYKFVLREDEIKPLIFRLYSDFNQKISALTFFRQFYFEALHFNTAFYLLMKSMASLKSCLVLDIPLFKDAYKEVNKLISTSFYMHMEGYQILSDTSDIRDKLSKHKLYCERLIEYVITKKTQVLLQIQVYDPSLGHAIYGILEPVIQENMGNVIGLQLIISNGGLGSENHARGKAPKKVESIDERIPMSWQYTNWSFFVDRTVKSSSKPVKYKGVKVNNITPNSAEMKAFCYYLMVCCGGYYLTQQKKICTAEYLIKVIYEPNTNLIKHSQWIKRPCLKPLVFFDVEQDMPEQVMGNCTVYNAMHAIRYAKKLNGLQFWYLNYVIEGGLDEVYSSLNPDLPTVNNPSLKIQ